MCYHINGEMTHVCIVFAYSCLFHKANTLVFIVLVFFDNIEVIISNIFLINLNLHKILKHLFQKIWCVFFRIWRKSDRSWTLIVKSFIMWESNFSNKFMKPQLNLPSCILFIIRVHTVTCANQTISVHRN